MLGFLVAKARSRGLKARSRGGLRLGVGGPKARDWGGSDCLKARLDG